MKIVGDALAFRFAGVFGLRAVHRSLTGGGAEANLQRLSLRQRGR